MSKGIRLAVFMLLVSLLAGCAGILTPSVSVKVTPNPIEFKFGELEKEITITLKTQGIGKLKVNNISVEIKDPDGEVVHTEEFELAVDSFIIPDVKHDEKQTISLPQEFEYATEAQYDEHLKGETYTLTLVVHGTTETKTSVNMKFI